ECKDIACPDGEALCKGGCFDLKTDINNCGECGNACGAKTCYNGECRFVCDTGQAICENGCADLKTDDKNCGECGHACDEGQSCRNGSCTVSCSTGETVCDDACTNLATDSQNCGECGHVCDAQKHETCQNKVCKLACDAGKDPCNGTCVDLDKDHNNCGACGHSCNAQKSEICQNGKCKVLCRENETLCDGSTCADLKSDKANCGTCGHACDDGEKCNDGTCSKDCGSLLDCNDSCIDPKTNALYCGASDTCTDDKAGQKCGDGFSCKDGQCACTDPNAKQCMINGIAICTDPDTDSAHCGCGPDDSGMNCTALSGTASAACNAGTCAFTCLDHFADCDDDTANGCETDLNTLENCGACNNACEDTNASKILCIAGACAYECKENTQLCEGHCRDLSEDDENCGACGHACTDGATCQKGFCTIPLNKCVEGYVTTTVNDKPIKAYCVRSELELEAIRNNINAGGKYPADNADNAYILMKDLDLGTRDWSPIGYGHAFTGTFLGNGKSITGKLTTHGSHVGLFGIITGSYIDNLNLNIDLTANGQYIENIGALVGFIYNSTIINVHETGSLVDPGAIHPDLYMADKMGGLAGSLVNSQISNSSANVNITFWGSGYVGGFIGALVGSEVSDCSSNSTVKGHEAWYEAISSFIGAALSPEVWNEIGWQTGWPSSQCNTIKNSSTSGLIDLSNNPSKGHTSSIGGLIGHLASCQTIHNCASSTTINAPSGHWAGGLIGHVYSQYNPQQYATITNSYATGDVTCWATCGGLGGYPQNLNISDSHASGKVTSAGIAGGLLGYIYQTTIKNSYATGDVISNGGTEGTGGLVGYFHGSSAENIYALGDVKTIGESNYTGGIAGRFYDSSINQAYAKGNVTGCHEIGGLIGELRRSNLNNCFAGGNVKSNDHPNCKNYTTGGGLIGDILDYGISNVTNCMSIGDVSGYPPLGSAIGYVSMGTNTLKNVFTTGKIQSSALSTGRFIGDFDNSNRWAPTRHGGSLAIKNSYYWSKAGDTAVVGGDTPQEPSVYGMIYHDNRAVLEDDPTAPLVNALGEDWTEVTCKLSSG
ncbi:MAG: hypothetical protein IJ268_06015, partial [Proteobacteria bacterium]|nr:hypothetical protein [Pseudomonadota bacterium]